MKKYQKEEKDEMIMQPRYLSRGKRLDNGEWVIGHYVRLYDSKKEINYIFTEFADFDCGEPYPDKFEIDLATLGQCTGLNDKNGKPIFEGDICKATRNIGYRYRKDDMAEIYYNNFLCHFALWDEKFGKKHGPNDVYALLWSKAKYTEIIGNIWDNYTE